MADAGDVENKVQGVVVGTVVQGRDMTILLPPALPVATAGLPAQPVFVGREAELIQLASFLAPISDRSRQLAVGVSVVAGLAGVGKSAVVIRAAHLAMRSGWFPGGVLMIDLRGYDLPERQITSTAALASLLVAIGVQREHIPSEQTDRQRLWRSILEERAATGRSLLIVVDNASRSEQVLPLLPGENEHRVLVTSRHTLADLQGVRLFELDVLSLDQSVQLLERELEVANPDVHRLRRDPQAAERLMRLCGGLPLAVRIISALLAAEVDKPLAEMNAALEDEARRLEELDYDGVLAVRSAFDLSYGNLTVAQSQMFRLLALNPGPEISTEAAAAAAGLGVIEGSRLVGQLRRAHLVQSGSSRNRWRMHDLVRLYATDLAARDPDRVHASIRLLDYYLAMVRAARQHLDRRVPSGERSPRFAARRNALEWLDAEYGNLVAAITMAHHGDYHDHVIGFSQGLLSYFMLRVRSNDWMIVHQLAVASARRLGDRRSEAGALHDLGIGHGRLGSIEVAMDYYSQALRAHQEVGNRSGQGKVLTSLGIVYRKLGRLDEALDCCLRSLDIQREVHDRHGEGMALNNLGIIYRTLGKLSDSLGCHQKALQVYRKEGDCQGEGASLSNLGVVYQHLGLPGKAIRCFGKSLLIRREMDDRHGEAMVLSYLGDCYRAGGSLDGALRYWRMALVSFETLPGVASAAQADRLAMLIACRDRG